MKTTHYSRKKRQLFLLATKLNRMLSNEVEHSKDRIQIAILKIKRFLHLLYGQIPKLDLIKALGSAALLFGLSANQHVNAQSFAAAKKNPFGLKSKAETLFINVVDIDGDGDLDVLAGESYGDFYFFKNTGTKSSPLFARETINPFGLTTSKDSSIVVPTMADLDDDGDMDLLVGQYYGSLSYYENTGTATNPTFGRPSQNPFGLALTDSSFVIPKFVDLDGDGDFDLMVGIEYGHFAYFENVGTKKTPSFAKPKTDPFGLVGAYYQAIPDFADLDNDGDLDLLVGEYEGNMVYYKNIGTAAKPAFESPVTNPFGITQTYYFAIPAFADFDNDGDQDLLVAEYYGAFQYFENTEGSAGVGAFSKQANLVLSPNPTKDILHISSNATPQKIEIYDLVGHQVMQISEPTNQISLGHLPAGMYDVRIVGVDGGVSNHKIVKQ